MRIRLAVWLFRRQNQGWKSDYAPPKTPPGGEEPGTHCGTTGFIPARFPIIPQLVHLPALILLSALSPRLEAQTLAHGVNLSNLGKGDWIRQMGAVESRLGATTTQAVINYEAGTDHVAGFYRARWLSH